MTDYQTFWMYCNFSDDRHLYIRQSNAILISTLIDKNTCFFFRLWGDFFGLPCHQIHSVAFSMCFFLSISNFCMKYGWNDQLNNPIIYCLQHSILFAIELHIFNSVEMDIFDIVEKFGRGRYSCGVQNGVFVYEIYSEKRIYMQRIKTVKLQSNGREWERPDFCEQPNLIFTG